MTNDNEHPSTAFFAAAFMRRSQTELATAIALAAGELEHQAGALETARIMNRIVSRLLASDAQTRATIPVPLQSGAERIAREVAERHGITLADLKGPKRHRHIVWPRQEAMAALRSELRLSYQTIGRFFGGRDHTTAIHAVAQHRRRTEVRRFEDATGARDVRHAV